MTISSAVSRNNYTGSGTTGPFAYSFKIFTSGDLDVIKTSTLGVQTTLTETTHYTVAGVGDTAGGTVTLGTALASGEALALLRSPDMTQTTSIRNQGAYQPAVIEDALDKEVMRDQYLQDQVNSSFRLPTGVDTTTFSTALPTPVGNANKALFVNAGVTALDLRTVDTASIALPGENRTVASATAYLANNALYNALDYGVVANGTDTRTTFLAALNAAKAAGGGTVRLPRGTYRMSGAGALDYLTIASNYDNITVEGEPGTVWQVTSDAVDYLVLVQNSVNFRFKGIKFGYATQPTVRDDTGPKGVRITGCTDFVIDDCEVSGSPQYGIGIETSTRPIVRGCRVHDTMADGINFNSCGRPKATGNVVYQTGDDGIAFSTPTAAAAGSRAEGAVAVGNTVYYSNSRGILMQADGGLIAGNNVGECSGANIAVLRDKAAADPGMRGRNITITGNTCTNANTVTAATGPNNGTRTQHGATSGGGAIHVASADATTFYTDVYHENISIVGNSIESPKRCAVLVQGAKGVTVVGNTLNNPCAAGDASFDFGIYVFSCNNVSVTGNVGYQDTLATNLVYITASSYVSASQNVGTTTTSVTASSPYRYESTDGAIRTINDVLQQLGTGTPEGAVTAPVGSMFYRTDGGAGTTLYVKQSGVGNTGWVGK